MNNDELANSSHKPCPAAVVIDAAMSTGPSTGWADGWLTYDRGVLEPERGTSRISLWRSAGRVWAILSEQLPSLVKSVTCRLRISAMVTVPADADNLPQGALIAAEVALSSLAHGYKWEWEKANPDKLWKLEELPGCVLEPWTTVCSRLHMPGPGLSVHTLFIGRYSLVDDGVWSVEEPYAERLDNLTFNPACFGSREERVFLGCFVETAAVFSSSIRAFVDAQQAVVDDDPFALRKALREVTTVCDRMVRAFHKISTSEAAGNKFYCDPIIWGRTIAPMFSPINPDEDSAGGSGLYHPVFHLLDVFFGRTRYDTMLGAESFHLRHWFPKNWQLLIDALDDPDYSIIEYVNSIERRRSKGESELPPLGRALDQARLAYVGERGWLGTHRYKVLGFLQIVSKAGRSNTNGGTSKEDATPWEAVHEELQNSRIERMRAGEGEIKRDGAGMCPFLGRVHEQKAIDSDPVKRTQQVVIDVPEGMWWKPGDRLMTIVPNSKEEVAAMVSALRRKLDDEIILDVKWTRWFEHASKTLKMSGRRHGTMRSVPLSLLVKFSTLRPLNHREVRSLGDGIAGHAHADCRIYEYLNSTTPQWPVSDTLASLVVDAVSHNPNAKFSSAKICSMLSPQNIRTYSISNDCPEENWQNTSARVELTVARQDFEVSGCPLDSEKSGVASGFLAPPPGTDRSSEDQKTDAHHEQDQVLVGLQSPLNFSLPSGDQPVVMFAAGSGIGPFRSFWEHRERQPRSETWLLLGCKDESTLAYKDDMDALLKRGQSDFRPYIALSRAPTKRVEFERGVGLQVVDGKSRGKYVADLLENDESLASAIVDLALSTSLGGRGASFYICGSVPFYQGLMQSLSKILAAHDIDLTDLISTMSSERRWKVEVFGSAKGSSKRLVDGKIIHSSKISNPVIWQSELAMHNGHYRGDEKFIAINKSVYDVTEFANSHPGGKRIVMDVAGTDATHDFELAAHDVNNEVMGTMEGLCVGQLRTIEGCMISNASMCQTESGRALPLLMDKAREMLYGIVQLQNVFENEFDSIADDQMGMTNIQRLGDSIGRFLQEMSGGESGSLGFRAAQEVSRLACHSLEEHGHPNSSAAALKGPDYLELVEYTSLVRDNMFEIDGLESVAARLVAQAKLNLDGIADKLKVIARQALSMIESIKQCMVASISDLEVVFKDILAGSMVVDRALLAKSIQLPSELVEVMKVKSKEASAALAMESNSSSSVDKASTLLELRSLKVPHYPETEALRASAVIRRASLVRKQTSKRASSILSESVFGLNAPLALDPNGTLSLEELEILEEQDLRDGRLRASVGLKSKPSIARPGERKCSEPRT